MRDNTTIVTAVSGLVLGVLIGALALFAAESAGKASADFSPTWSEVRWPFPMDQWGKGTAFRCPAAQCGADVTLYLRAKIGFCKCSGGLADDTELDRISDAELLGGTLYPQAAGQPVKAGWMNGRSRPFATRSAELGNATMIVIGLHDNCDALVATALLSRGDLAAAEPAVQDFLNSRTFADWAEATLGL